MMRRISYIAGYCAIVLVVVGAAQQPPSQQPPVNRIAATQADFLERVKLYLDLRNKLEGSMPKLGKDASPKEIDRHQRELGLLVAKARPTAKVGDIFTEPMRSYVREEFKRIFRGPNGVKLRDAVQDEKNQRQIVLKVNERYPDTIPLSTMPVDVLEALPKLPEIGGLEYRFIGRRLILLDSPAHIIVDYVENALPEPGALPARGAPGL
jgi:hypothetical protein